MPALQGILPAIVTPVDARECFRAAAFERLVERLYRAGVDGLYVCGQTGEGWQQTAAQRKLVAEAAVRCSPRGKTVIVHVGAQSTAEAVDLARHAASAGAHAVSSLPPAGGYPFDEVREYYRTLAAASPLPLLIYYFPSLSPSIRTLDQILELCALPNVAGLKFTDSDLYRVWVIRRSGAVVFNGSDEMLVAGLLIGACGGIGSIYNLLPDEFAALYRLSAAGAWTEARAVQDRINGLIQAILQFPLIAAVKTMLAWTGLDCGPVIAPRRMLTPAEQDELRALVARTAYADRFRTAAAAR